MKRLHLIRAAFGGQRGGYPRKRWHAGIPIAESTRLLATLQVTAVATWFGSNQKQARHAAKLLSNACWIGVPFAGGMVELTHLRARTIVVSDLHRGVVIVARFMADPALGTKLYRAL